jgi:hypothetical protein
MRKEGSGRDAGGIGLKQKTEEYSPKGAIGLAELAYAVRTVAGACSRCWERICKSLTYL